MRIQHNIMAMNAYRNYNTNTSALSKNLEKLSSGYKINRAGDDAAGLAISEKMRAQITGLNAAQKNVKDGISLVKTAEGAMQEIQDMLNRMDYLATQSANGTYDNEVDRMNLQKEVDQLRSEINRIADSANFNGIKLLDGKAGVNTTAFTKFENLNSAAATDGKLDISGALSAADAGATITHMEGQSANQKNPEAIIDLGDLSVSGLAATDTATLTLNIFGKDVAVQLNGQTSYAKSDIVSALTSALQKDSSAVDATNGSANTTSGDAIKVGDNVYKFETHADGIKVSLAGVFNGTNYQAASATPDSTSKDFTEAQAEQMNKDLGMEVSVKGLSKGSVSGDVVHKTTQVQSAVAHVDATKAGIDLTLNSDIVKQGNKLVIDGKEITFELENATNTGSSIVNLADMKDKTEDEILHAAADRLSKLNTLTGTENRTWKIGTGKDGKTIHIEQTTASSTGKELDTYEKLTSKISVQGAPAAAQGAGVAITVKADKIAAGNKLNIDDKTYTFVKGTADATKNEISIDGDVMGNIQTALGTTYDVSVANGTEDGTKILNIRAKVASDAEAAASESPVITGDGLQLQIGDTSESYNQLSVKIGDMHTKALGIDKLSIADPEGASAAIQTIRDAINQVSSVRGDLGATQNRLEHTANNLSVMAENIQDAESTIRDTDVAEEMMAYTKNNILVQSAQAMLAQANAVPQGVLQLLG